MRVLERLALCAPLPTCLRGSCLCAVVALLARVGGTLLVIGCPPVAHAPAALWACSVVVLRGAAAAGRRRATHLALVRFPASPACSCARHACCSHCRALLQGLPALVQTAPAPLATSSVPSPSLLAQWCVESSLLPTSFPFLCPPFNCSYTREKRERPSAGRPAPTLAPAHQRAPNIKGADSLLLAASSRSLPARAAPGCSPSSWPSTTWTPSARPWW